MNKLFLVTDLPLLASSGEEIGRMVVSITSTVTPMSTVLTQATRDVDALANLQVAGYVQTSVQGVTSAPIVAALTDNSDPWKSIRDRLEILMGWGDAIAEVWHVSSLFGNPSHHTSRPPRFIRMSISHGE